VWHNHGVRASQQRKPRPPLDEEALERLGLFYAGRYATTRAKLAAYLLRKVRERGWEGRASPPIERLVQRFAELGYVNDEAFASSRAAALTRRGYGERRVNDALFAAGLEDQDAEPARALAKEGAGEAALAFARRKRIGPFAETAPDRAGYQKAMAAMLRAGHPSTLARRILASRPGEVPELDDI
jgi:regulatory protein